jgi:hypothetical protein
MIQGADTTVEAAIDQALDAYARLAELGEEVEDEWSYIQDLTEAWRALFAAVVARRGNDLVERDIAAGLEAAIDEIARIEDPHRAIDWLSTFPQITLLALGETS